METNAAAPRSVYEFRISLRAAGFAPVPVAGKRPVLKDWQTKLDVDEAEVASWDTSFPGCTNTGILTAHTPALDIDIRQQDAADAVSELVRELYGDKGKLLTRFGLAPKRAILFRTDQPFSKQRVAFTAPDGSSHAIEMLGSGQQIVVDGIHPDTHKPYSWHGGRAPGDVQWADLPEIEEEEAATLLTLIADMLAEHFWFEQQTISSTAPLQQGGADRPPVDIEVEIAALNSGTSVNAVQTRLIPSLLHRMHPDEVLEFIVSTTMEMAERKGLGWSRDEEVTAVRKRILSAYNNLMLRDYDHTTGVIPSWLPGEFHTAWTARLQDGVRPVFGFNRGGFYIRTKQGTGPDDETQYGATVIPFDGDTAQPTTEAKKPPPPRFKLLHYSDLRPGMGDQDYLVDELFPAEGLVVVWGKFKCLKTFFMYDVCLHIAKGWEYRDRAVRQGLVVYCAFEGSHGFGKRTEAQRRHYNLADDDNAPIRVMGAQMNLVADHKRFLADIKEQLAEGERPAIVVLDTLNRSLVGSESKDVDMSAYIAAAGAIREAFKCLVVIVHHCGWDESRPRGHSSLSGAIDGQLAVTRQENHIAVTVEFLRDGPEGVEIHSTTKIIEVGHDPNGKPLTSLVVVPSDSTAPTGAWPKALVVFRRAMKTALANHGEDFQENILEPPVRAVATDEVRTEFYEIYPARGDGPDQRQATKQKQFRRCLERAQIDGLVQIREPSNRPQLVWFTGRTATWEGE
jgi:hypothetical protein